MQRFAAAAEVEAVLAPPAADLIREGVVSLADPVAALRELGCETTLVPTQHAVVDIVRFQRLTLAVAESSRIDPDRFRGDHERWARGRAVYR